MKMLSLFSGIGGIDLAARWAGIETAAFCEIEPFCQQVLRKNFGQDIVIFDDVRTLTAESLRAKGIEPESISMVAGGDPCQANSGARTRGGKAKPSLGSDFIRIVDEVRPLVVLRENPSVTKKNAPYPASVFKLALESLGYAVLPVKSRACCVGADHRRERLFLLAALPDADSKLIRLSGCRADDTAPGTDKSEASQRQWVRPDANSILRFEQYRANTEALGETNGIPNRVDRLRALGNAVVPQQVYPILKAVMDYESQQI